MKMEFTGAQFFFKDFKSEEVEHSYIGKLRFQRFIQSIATPYQYILKIERIVQTGFVIFNKYHDPLYYFETFSKKL